MSLPCSNTPFDNEEEGLHINMQYEQSNEPEDLSRWSNAELNTMASTLPPMITSGLARAAINEVIKLRNLAAKGSNER